MIPISFMMTVSRMTVCIMLLSDTSQFCGIIIAGSGKKSRPSSSRSKSPKDKDKKGRDKSGSPKRSASSKKSEVGSKKGSRGKEAFASLRIS